MRAQLEVEVSNDEMERFCAEAYPLLVGALSHECGDVHLAEEFAQEALLRACQRWETVSQLEAPVGWCLRVGLNLSRSWYRRRVVARRARSHLADDRTHHDVDIATQHAVRDALASLTPKQRDAVLLRYFLDLSAEQTAEALSSTPGAVRALAHRAVQTLREELNTTFPTEFEEASDGA